MKKTALLLAGLCLSSAVFAQSVRVINTDPVAMMTITYQTCIAQPSTGNPAVCGNPTTVSIKSNKWGTNYLDITVPDAQPVSPQNMNYLVIHKATATGGDRPAESADLNCGGSVTGDTVLLNTYNTDKVICIDHASFGNSSNNFVKK